MNKTIVIGGLAVFIVVFFCQTALATNESDYKWGYWYGFGNYQCLNPPDHTDPCSPTSLQDQSNMTYGCVENSIVEGNMVHCYPPGGITNQTAYRDGFLDGWAHWCKTDAKDCDKLPQPHL
jgi:hypothetical protein